MRGRFGVDELRVGDRRQQLPAADVLARVDVDLADIAGDQRRQRARLRTLDNAAFGKLRLIAPVGDGHDPNRERLAVRPGRDDTDDHDRG